MAGQSARFQPTIAADWWGKDHGTVCNAVDLVTDLRETKPAYDKQFRRFALFSRNYIQRKDSH